MRWRLGHGRYLDLGAKSVLMGILNATPDSFSDGGEFQRPEQAVARARQMLDEGAAIIDVGGESTRPGAEPVSAREEQARILPIIEQLVSEGRALISVDTYRSDTARLAGAAGAHIVNDIHALQR
jgi:dihydropteroate synthase